MSPQVVWLLIIAGVSIAIGLVTTFTTRAVTRRVGFVAKPRAERWHKRPTALAGGVGIFLAFMPVALYLGEGLRLQLLLGATAMFVLGLVDDVVMLKPYTKLTGQLVIAGLTVASGQSLPWTPWPLLNQAIGMFWIIGLTNALNLLDNMDGLAGGVACVVACFQAAFFAIQHQPTEAAVCTALAGSLAAFLVFNWNPASIFMGDCGSLFLGYSLSVLALHQSYGRSRSVVAVIAAPLLVMLVPIFDTTFVTVTRILRGRPVSQGGRDHTSHRLVTLGMSERKAVALLIALGVLGGIIALSARQGFIVGVWLAAPLLLIGLAFLAIHLARTDRPDLLLPGRVNLLTWVATFAYKRRIFEVLLDATLAMVALSAAFLLRFDGEIPADTGRDLLRVFPVIIVAKVAVLLVVGAYDGVWQYIGVRDVLKFVRGSIIATALTLVIVALWFRLGALSRGALVIDGILFASLVGASRVGFRVLRLFLGGPHDDAQSIKVLLWGAGDAGASLVRKLLDAPEERFIPVGFIDDDPTKLGRSIHGLKVLGSSGDVMPLLASQADHQILITTNKVPLDRVREMIERLGVGRVRRLRLVVEDVPLPRISSRSLPEVTDVGD